PKHIRLITLRVSNLIPITLLSSKPSRFRDIFDNLLSKYYSLHKGKPPSAKAVAFVPPATSLFDSAIYPIIQYGGILGENKYIRMPIYIFPRNLRA
ncbi:MAG: hypothetical protein E6Z25_07315, partial [Negativicoccus succinicivorans]|uniref:hypothetical protein n=1 Tax=Negativicoccus succinicivorans TaxID=620903 RepID=UPI00290C0397